MRFQRRLELRHTSVEVTETVTNVAACDRPIGWTQHVTLGPPFLEHGITEFRASATRSRVFEGTSVQRTTSWLVPTSIGPTHPERHGGVADLSASPMRRARAPTRRTSWIPHGPMHSSSRFVRKRQFAFGYLWRRADFPWLGIWEENRSRTASPWNGREVTRGMEFGVSPFPETRREMIDRGRLFDEPTYRWIPARSQVTVEYRIMVLQPRGVPDALP